MCVCVCLKDGEVSRDPPASSPRVLVALPDASQCFHGVLEMEGDSLIYHTTTHTHRKKERLPPLSIKPQFVLLSYNSNFYLLTDLMYVRTAWYFTKCSILENSEPHPSINTKIIDPPSFTCP